MSSIDNRVVQMEFDNAAFEKGVSTTTTSLKNLKSSLDKLGGGTDTLNGISSSAKKLDFSSLASSVDTISDRFSTLGVIATTVLVNLTNKVVDLGTQMVKSLAVDGIIDGWSEYELKLGSIQTILANTQSKGTTLDDINSALDELNHYADQTIYVFSQMTQNIGRFTAAGVDLETSVASIKGISNLAAMSGSTATQASTAMYQLSQAIAAGKVSLQDWNSVVNAGMGGEAFQTALKRTAENFGYNVDEMIETYGSFRESLTEGGWLTTEVLTETLAQISGAYTEADLIAQGYTKDQAKAIVEMAATAEEAATKIRTFSQLIDTVKESIGSGWAETFEIIFGDFEEATELFSTMGEVVTGAVDDMTDARNDLLQGWKDLGGREDLISGLTTAFESLSSIVGVVSEKFREVFPATTSQQLKNFTQGFKDLMESLTPSEKTLERIGRIAEGVFSVFSIGKQVLSTLISPIATLVGSSGFGGLVDVLLEVAASVGDFFTALDKGLKAGDVLGELSDSMSEVVSWFSEGLDTITSNFSSFGSTLSAIASVISDALGIVGSAISNVVSWVKENISLGDIFTGLGIGALITGSKKVSEVLDTIKGSITDLISGESGPAGTLKDLANNFSEALDTLKNSLSTFSTGVKVGSVVAIAGAVWILTDALETIGSLKMTDITEGIIGIGAIMTEMIVAFKALTKAVSGVSTGDMIKTGVALIALGTAVNIFAKALVAIADLDFDEVAVGLVTIGVALAEMVAAVKVISGSNVSLKTSIAIVAVAEACKILAEAIVEFSGLSWEEIAKGLVAMGGALAELVAVIAVLGKVGGGSSLLGSASLLVAVQSLDEIAEALDKLSDLSWEEIGKGLVAMGGALAELGIVVGALGTVAGFSGVLGGGAILIVSQALEPISETLQTLGDMTWEEIAKGLVAMGGAVGELAIIVGVLGGLAGASSILGGGAILITVQALEPISTTLQDLGLMSWEEIGKGLVAMGAALAEIAVISGALGYLTGISGLFGAGTITLAVQGLDELANGLQKFGSMSWEEIGKGLVAMGGALGEIAVISGVTGVLSNIAGLVGAGTISLAAQGLIELGDALQKFGSMSWEEIGQGLVAMGAAMGETALGGVLNTFSGFGASNIAEMAPALGELADSVKKWADVTVPDGLSSQLGSLAKGVESFTLSGWGGSAIAEVAEPLGTLATSIKKWSKVTVPEELGSQIGSLASGIDKFTFSGWGGSAIAEVAEPLGTLATAIKKWSNVTVPEDLGTQLKTLASGVEKFTFSGWGAENLSSVAGPLGDLATAVKKWTSIEIPENLGSQFSSLADGLSKFSIENGDAITSVADGLSSLSISVSSLSGIDFVTIGGNITSFATSIQDIPEQVSEVSSLLEAALGSISSAISGKSAEISTAFGDLITSGLSSLTSNTSQFTSVGQTLANALTSALSESISEGSNTVNSGITLLAASLLLNATTQFKSVASSFKTLGAKMAERLAEGIESKDDKVKSAAKAVAEAGATAINNAKSSYYTAGANLIDGLASGITANQSKAITAASNTAAKALAAAQSELEISSPSRKFAELGMYADQGLAKGLDDYSNEVVNSGRTLASRLNDAVQSSVNSLSYDFGDTVIEPTIRPVVDMTNYDAIDWATDKTLSFSGVSSIGSVSKSVENRISALEKKEAEFNKASAGETKNITFNQNNYSPKSLSRIDIYRDTKNQLSRMKKEL